MAKKNKLSKKEKRSMLRFLQRGDNFMATSMEDFKRKKPKKKLYRVYSTVAYTCVYEVNATSEDDAKDMVISGKVDYHYRIDLASDSYDVVKVKQPHKRPSR